MPEFTLSLQLKLVGLKRQRILNSQFGAKGICFDFRDQLDAEVWVDPR
jgi:hypothetical protein